MQVHNLKSHELGGPLRIGPVVLQSPTVLAPLSEITLRPLRRLVRRLSGPHLGLVVAPLVSVEGLLRHNRATRDLVRLHEDEGPVAVQLFGGNPERMAEGAAVARAEGAHIIDINCGCPARKVQRSGGGVALADDPLLFTRVVKAVVGVVDVPVTVKLRSGRDGASINALELSRRAEDAGASALTIHGRTAAQGYRGEADWDIVERIADAVRIPVIGSGDITSAPDLKRRLASPGVAGVMVGRAILRNPWIFAQAGNLDSDASVAGDGLGGGAKTHGGEPPSLPDPLQNVRRLLDLYLDILKEEGVEEKQLVCRVRHMTMNCIRGVPQAASIRRSMGEARTPEEIIASIAG